MKGKEKEGLEEEGRRLTDMAFFRLKLFEEGWRKLDQSDGLGVVADGEVEACF